ncbi:MAG TPA: sodium:calcium antiporter [Acidimicrobiia bacterium]|nr:sodium:calcium antiporter [Acidimicrobiia bacterium]
MSALPPTALLGIFLAAGAAIWLAGIRLSDATDILETRLGLGEAFGGVILLAIATNLPEIAIVATASLAGDLGIAVGNILGGVAIQTVVLVGLDVVGLPGAVAFTYRGASLIVLLEAGTVVAVLTVTVMGTQLPSSLSWWRVDPAALLIAVVWGAGLVLVRRARKGLPWHRDGQPPDGQERPRGHSKKAKAQGAGGRQVSTARAAVEFAVGAVATLAAGILLERSGEVIATHIHMSGILFGSTVLAAATALPELSTGLAAVRMGDYQLAFGDIFGGNAFLPVLFLPASLLSGQAVVTQAQVTDIYLAGLGALLTVVYMFGIVFRPSRTIARMGLDSAVVLLLYLLGMAGLVAIATS